jgi:hypothetical protein
MEKILYKNPAILNHFDMLYRAFNNYVDKMRGEGVSVFVHAQGIKTVHAGGGGQKMAKFCPR